MRRRRWNEKLWNPRAPLTPGGRAREPGWDKEIGTLLTTETNNQFMRTQDRRNLGTSGGRTPGNTTLAVEGPENAEGPLTRRRGLTQIRKVLGGIGRRSPGPAAFARKEAKCVRGMGTRGPHAPPMLARPGGMGGCWAPLRRRGAGAPATPTYQRVLELDPRGPKCRPLRAGPTAGRRD